MGPDRPRLASGPPRAAGWIVPPAAAGQEEGGKRPPGSAAADRGAGAGVGGCLLSPNRAVAAAPFGPDSGGPRRDLAGGGLGPSGGKEGTAAYVAGQAAGGKTGGPERAQADGAGGDKMSRRGPGPRPGSVYRSSPGSVMPGDLRPRPQRATLLSPTPQGS